jgi:hypothetical protein
MGAGAGAMSAKRERVNGFGRLEDGLRQSSDWYLWGPYVSERQWGTVREDYSADGEAWDYLPHDHARSRAYRWGEDGLAGFCDVERRLCLGLAYPAFDANNQPNRTPQRQRPAWSEIWPMPIDPGLQP